VLKLDETIEVLAQRFADKQNALFLGRGTHYPIAMEGALKLKEISYIHAEANIQEVSARGGQLIVFMDETLAESSDENVQIIKMPSVANIISPIIYTIPLQLLSYHVAVLKGTDVDQPRNLAKSVTVE
jgi:glutamine---fructose-6-phosphate transaminase (isomerizing)